MSIKSIIDTIKPFLSKKIVIPVLIVLALIAFQQVKAVFESQMIAKMRMAPVEVSIGTVTEDDISTTTKSSGRVVACKIVNVVSRVNGWLQTKYFQEGSIVKKGQLLYKIEPNEYQNAVNQASAAVRESQAQLINYEKSLRRAKELVKQDFVSKSYYDDALAKRDSTKAMLDVNRANLAQARLNLSYTNIYSPIDGKVGDIFISEGNLVNTSSGTLVRILSIDPIYVSFTMKSEDYLSYIKSYTGKNENVDKLSFIIPQIIMSDGTTYDEKGEIDFVDNEVDINSGTISLRATFSNKKRLLVPGDFVTVKTTSKYKQHVALLPQDAVIETSKGSFVYVVDEDNKAQLKQFQKAGQYNGNWIVIDGLKAGDKFISTNLQKLKPGSKVKIIENKSENGKK
ncbi:MAG: efflux RND transporter periplasmic adaptor subunit [Candidatus Gastranaerophilales bacterium]|nr:efflux RND transporter periplasmic adaptor subunit [Candidatus Gastranaerophilales bacterium]